MEETNFNQPDSNQVNSNQANATETNNKNLGKIIIGIILAVILLIGAFSSTDDNFTNEYGTPNTICAHSGCTRKIASSGDTNCCTLHSNRCKKCHCYIDEDATWCWECISGK